MKRLAVTSLTLIALAACGSPGSTTIEPLPANQHWICGSEYVNLAWGYQRRGAVVDNDGHVWRYEFKGTPASLPNPWQPKDMTKLTEAELNARYNGAADVGQRTSPDDVAQHMPLIREAAQTPPTPGRQAAADMGAYVFYCLARNVPGGGYRQILLDQWGDVQSTNPSSAAKELTAWLKKVLGSTTP